MAELTPADHEDRLRAMTEPDQQTWDLSRNDVAAVTWVVAELARLRAENARLLALLNTPETLDFVRAVPLEAAHQRERWGSAHDAGKTPADWFWLVGYLAGKALHAQAAGDTGKVLHHTISTAAVLCNWHAAVLGKTDMRPGIEPPEFEDPSPSPETTEPPRWQDRLVFDFNVSEVSPVVKGTWVTVGHVVSLIVDGWTWADILRTHPELTEGDIRVCLAYTLEQETEAPGA